MSCRNNEKAAWIRMVIYNCYTSIIKMVQNFWVSTSNKYTRLLWNCFQGESEFDNFLGDEPESNFKRRNSNSIRKEVREFSLDNLQGFDEKVSKEEKETENTDNQDIKSWMWNLVIDINVFSKDSSIKNYYIRNKFKKNVNCF